MVRVKQSRISMILNSRTTVNDWLQNFNSEQNSINYIFIWLNGKYLYLMKYYISSGQCFDSDRN